MLKKSANNNAPILVIQQAFLVGFEVLVYVTCILGLDKTFGFGTDFVIDFASIAIMTTGTRA